MSRRRMSASVWVSLLLMSGCIVDGVGGLAIAE